MANIKFKKDRYRRARGGYSRLLEISCEHCNNVVALYQKDGPGSLKRMYLDRIMEPKKLTGVANMPTRKMPHLICAKCKQVIGIPYIYQKEKRPAYRPFEGAVRKKIVKAA